MPVVKNPYANCTAVDPERCRYHGKQFSNERFRYFSSASHMFDVLDERVPAEKIIPFFEPNIDVYLEEAMTIRDNLDAETTYALHRYSDEHGSRKITTYLHNPNVRFHDETEESIEQQIAKIDSYIAEHTPSRRERVIYRGIEKLGVGFEELQVGKKIQFKNFLSTSSSSDVARTFTNKNHPVLLEIITDKGVPLYSNYFEFEYLLPRNMVFRVASITENVTIEGKRSDKPTFGATLIRLIEEK